MLEILELYRAIEDVKRSSKDNRLTRNSYPIILGFDGSCKINIWIFVDF